jgi:hypothetical protein
MNQRNYLAVVKGILVLSALWLAGCIAPAAPLAPGQEPAVSGQEEIGVYATNTGAFADLDPSSGYTNEQLVNTNLYETLTVYSRWVASNRLLLNWQLAGKPQRMV